MFEEGTCIPHLKLVDAGRLNEDLLAIIQANSRNPVEARGDILSLVSSNEVGCARLLEMMAEFSLTTLDALARAHPDAVARRPRCGDRAAARGSWEARMRLDGYERRSSCGRG